PNCGARRLASLVAAAATLPGGDRARRLMEHEAARAERLAGAREPRSETRLLAAGDSRSPRALDAVLPRQCGGHGRPLACRVPARLRDPARARLVSPGRLPWQRGPLRPTNPGPVQGVAPRARGALRAPLRRTTGLQR